MRTYTQLTQVQRYQISALKKMEHTPSEKAQVLKVNRSTVGRELRRNTGGCGYRPKQADEKAMSRRPKAKPRIETDEWKVVEEKLRQDWSPEQVSGWLKKQAEPSISHEWIYQHILTDKHSGGELYKHLRCQKKHRKRYGSPERRGKLPNRVSIEERPEVVNQRERLGDWEVDTVVGKNQQGALLSLVERKSRYTLLGLVQRRHADLVKQAIVSLLMPLTERVLSITSDNGKEFAEHVQIAEALDVAFYFRECLKEWAKMGV
jgi:IS30 family transposase